MPRTSIFAVTGAVLGSFLSVSAFAFPAAPHDAKAPSDLILVEGGCGPGFHRGPYGRCYPNEIPHRVCPYGMHWAPFWHRCVRNW
jgi:hypothetical protein